MQAKGIVGYGNKVTDSMFASNQTRSGVRENLMRKVKADELSVRLATLVLPTSFIGQQK
jgi:hypothetical protein